MKKLTVLIVLHLNLWAWKALGFFFLSFEIALINDDTNKCVEIPLKPLYSYGIGDFPYLWINTK